ncbi:hypothetical protein AAVH_08926 [Aphelenchoides avenae]|nr:hypothetical protein AAVH_08926 [Aphelenchus avenae]
MTQTGSALVKLQALNEYQTQYFGFTTKGMVDTHYNCLMTIWGKVVDSMLLPALLTGTERKEKADKLRVKLLNQIFQKGRLDIILQKFEVRPAIIRCW